MQPSQIWLPASQNRIVIAPVVQQPPLALFACEPQKTAYVSKAVGSLELLLVASAAGITHHVCMLLASCIMSDAMVAGQFIAVGW